MKKTLLFVLILSGLSILSTGPVSQYYYIETLKTWAEAQSYCREKFNDLATVNSRSDSDRLLSALQGHGEPAWIGLYDDLTKWKWSLKGVKFDNATDFSNWEEDEPNNVPLNTACAAIGGKGSWFASGCGMNRPAVCYHANAPSTLIVLEIDQTWFQARNECRTNYTDLATVTSMSENEIITSLLSGKSWFGLHRRTWDYWSNKKRRTFLNWERGQPDNRSKDPQCAIVDTTTGKWSDSACEEKHHFVCQKVPIEHRTTFKLKLKSEADLNNPAVQQQILEQLHAKLGERGLSDFKLRWTKINGPEKEEEGSNG